MKQNTIHLIYPILLLLKTITCGAVDGPLLKVEVTAVDCAGQPIRGAEVEVTDKATTNYVEGHFAQGLTDEKGQCQLSLRALFGVGLYCEKKGKYYPSKSSDTSSPLESEKPLKKARPDQPPFSPTTLKGSVTLRQIKNPIPLYAGVLQLDFPARDVWLGFDLEVGDWVPPYGRGKRSDIRFRSAPAPFSRQDKKTGDAPGKAILEISPDEGGGFIKVTERNGYLRYSDMKMPHEAPAGGYDETPVLKIEHKGTDRPPYAPNTGYFFRTRVVREVGKVVSAHYAKIPEDFQFLPEERPGKPQNPHGGDRSVFGGVVFTYYFNPTANDRNLEFDPKRNLLENGEAGSVEFQ